MRWLYRYAIWHPKTVMVIAVLVTLAIAPGILRLKIRTDGHALVPAEAKPVVFDRAVRDEFGVEDPIVVMIRADDPHGVFNADTVKLIKSLTQEFKKIAGVRPSDVTSLDTEHNYRVWQGTLKFRTFLDPLPQTRAELDALRADLRDIKLYDGTIIGFDDHYASILVGVPAQMGRADLYTRMQDIIAGLGEIPEEIHVIGAPVAEALLGTHILEDLGVPDVVLGHRLGRDDVAWRFPRSLYELRRLVARRVGLAPAAIGIMMLVFLVSFRRPMAAIMPLLEVLACLIAVFGLMGWLGVPVYLTIAVLPVILTVSGVQDEIHLFNRCVRELREHPEQDRRRSILTALDEMYPPIVKTTVSTAVGFVSFAISPLAPVRAFGAFAAVGMFYCMLWSFAVIPAQLVMTDPRRWLVWRSTRDDSGQAGIARFFTRWTAGVVRCRYLILGVAVLATVLAPLGVRKIIVQDSWIDGFARKSEFYQATQAFNNQFLGTHMLLVCLDTGHSSLRGELEPEAVGDHTFFLPGDLVSDPAALVGLSVEFKRSGSPLAGVPPASPRDPRRMWQSRKSRVETAMRQGDRLVITTPRKDALIKTLIGLVPGEKLAYEITPRRLTQPDVLRRIGELEDFIRAHTAQAVGGVLGPPDYLATTRFMKLRREEKRIIPDTPDEVEILWGDYANVRGQERLRQIVDAHFARGLVSIFLKNANFVDTQRLMDDVRAYEREHLTPQGISLEFAGDVAVSQTLIEAIVTTQVRSLIASPLGILVITVVLGRSLLWGVISVLPCALGLLLNFAVIGLVGMPLGVASSMFASMILGIGVDYAIHLVERYRLGRARGLAWEAALTETVTHTGPPVLVDAVSVSLGFSIMMLSQVPANARLGALLVLSIGGCFATTLVLLPALVSLGHVRKGRMDPRSP